jgi:sugar lactone lactonase YvrE
MWTAEHHSQSHGFEVVPNVLLLNAVLAQHTRRIRRVFCEMASAAPGVPDGIKVDTAGRVWCVGSGGIWVVAPSGEVLGIVQTPEVVRNLAFGGPDFRTLYLTPGGSLAKLEVTTPGIGAWSA